MQRLIVPVLMRYSLFICCKTWPYKPNTIYSGVPSTLGVQNWAMR